VPCFEAVSRPVCSLCPTQVRATLIAVRRSKIIDRADTSSPDGLDGCCDQNAVSLGGFDCGISAANATIFVRLTSIDAACVPYELSFDY